MDLIFSAEGRSWPLRLTGDAERTRRALLLALPMRLQLHTPKIAGSHIYWHAPFVEDIEGATHVLSATAGAFIYWPVRQFLEITFAPLQAENAEITVLGHLDAPVEGIAELAATLKRDQGRRILEGTLVRSDGSVSEPSPPSPLPQDIIAARKALWASCPADISRVTASRAIMHPAGPVFTAESEARVLHEFLWWVHAERGRKDELVMRQAAAIALDKTATRLRDFCHMEETPALLFRLKAAMGDDHPFDALIDEAILVAGRIGAWLDLLIPWNDLNEAFRAALDGRKAG
ncbi:hypothetical protein EJ076_32495 [Mesorhizobium sp. M7D.F.Ca.US.005.01.1.1]|uniref:hypothetical protein n=1 Tax=Mesorhizobium sp. M7D.F.Ca.US.005.01.1.1 TaxID=2493678 RepID=UPI000F752F4F|nr:hypothetical protein [Mesorhizobium sp. M7D.F.Ca.US.005.01.1.1]AZO45489.1 hypothetical protein EJ076_32495 [Mesorhizobium sp. M7D.F.Ca.US.005.01.1.1]